MSWLDIALIGAVLVGVTAGTALVVRNPVFWAGLATSMLNAALPYITKRLKPAEEEEWRKAERAGRGDEWRRRRLGLPPKG